MAKLILVFFSQIDYSSFPLKLFQIFILFFFYCNSVFGAIEKCSKLLTPLPDEVARIFWKDDQQILVTSEPNFFNKVFFQYLNAPVPAIHHYKDFLAIEVSSDVIDLSRGPYRKPSRFRFFYTHNQRIIFQFHQLKELEESVRGILSASEIHGHQMISMVDSIFHSSEYNVDITDIVPDFIRTRVGAFRPGANCVNTACQVLGLRSSFEVTSPEALESILRSDRCKPRMGLPMPGDMVVVYEFASVPEGANLEGEKARPVHAFVYYSDFVGFEKPDWYFSRPYGFIDPNSIYDHYRVSSQNLYPNEIPKNENSFTKAFSCL